MKELFEIGFFMCLFNFSNIWLSITEWFCVLVGFLIQYILLRKGRGMATKWGFPCLLLVGIIISECMVWTITGWDRLAVALIYGFIVCLMLGAVLAWLVYRLPGWIKKDNQKFRRKLL